MNRIFVFASLLFGLGSGSAMASSPVIYKANQMTCSSLNQVLDSQGRIEIYQSNNAYKLFARGRLPRCESTGATPTQWSPFFAQAKDGSCSLGFLCTLAGSSKHQKPAKSSSRRQKSITDRWPRLGPPSKAFDRMPEFRKRQMDYPGKPNIDD